MAYRREVRFLKFFYFLARTPVNGLSNVAQSNRFKWIYYSVGCGFPLRKIANQQKPTVVFEIEGDRWTMTSITTFKTGVSSFVLGEEVDEVTPDGRKMKVSKGIQERVQKNR